MIYRISELNEVNFFHKEDSPSPIYTYPRYPNGDAFESLEQATAWAEAFLAYHSGETTPVFPMGKGLEGAARTRLLPDGTGQQWNEETQSWDQID